MNVTDGGRGHLSDALVILGIIVILVSSVGAAIELCGEAGNWTARV